MCRDWRHARRRQERTTATVVGVEPAFELIEVAKEERGYFADR